MAVKIRLKRIGMKRAPHYRIVVSDARSPRDGRFIEELGIYSPKSNPLKLRIDLERAEEWIANGAQPTDTVRRLMKRYEEMTEEEREASSGISKPAAKAVTIDSKKPAKPARIKEEVEVAPVAEASVEEAEEAEEAEVEVEEAATKEAPADTTEEETEEPA